jgi:Sec-independent protein secretion pathway component TatC
MELDLKRLFARSMSGDLELAEAPVSPRSAKRRLMFVTLAGILAVIGAVVAAYYFAMTPVILRIAVGPANSDDIKVVQALTQAFTQAHSHIRLRPIQT